MCIARNRDAPSRKDMDNKHGRGAEDRTGTALQAVAAGGPYSDSPLKSAHLHHPGGSTLNQPAGGSYICTQASAVIYDTTDSSTPNHFSPRYTGSFTVSGSVGSTVTVKAPTRE
jgi:Chitobiase/beta-hexosaminidase C-terminal domain